MMRQTLSKKGCLKDPHGVASSEEEYYLPYALEAKGKDQILFRIGALRALYFQRNDKEVYCLRHLALYDLAPFGGLAFESKSL